MVQNKQELTAARAALPDNVQILAMGEVENMGERSERENATLNLWGFFWL